MVFVDLDRESIPEDDQMQSKAKWTPYVGWQLVGYPVMTYLRGEKIAQEGQVLGEPGYGRYIEGRSVQT
jgi:dihydroorotase-like cyclic amidohydrolase